MPAATAGPRTSASPVRARILAAAAARFYADGIRAVSADKIIAAAGVSKVTFYRHFPTKDELVVAYLEANADREREELERIRAAHRDDPAGTLAALADALGDLARSPQFRGCSFVNAGAEYADPAHAVRLVVDGHRGWYTRYFADIAGDAGTDDPEAVAAELLMLRDGAMVCGDLGTDTAAVGPRLAAAFAAVLAAHRVRGAHGTDPRRPASGTTPAT